MNGENIYIELNNHIILVNDYIDRICNKILTSTNYSENIENMTLIDLILHFIYNRMLPKYDRVFYSLNNNTYMSFSVKSNLLSKEDIIIYFINELQNRKNNHDKLLLQELKQYKTDLLLLEELINKHKKISRHHIEYFTNGINDMNIFDITEMFCCDNAKINIPFYNENLNIDRIPSKNLVKILNNTKNIIDINR